MVKRYLVCRKRNTAEEFLGTVENARKLLEYLEGWTLWPGI